MKLDKLFISFIIFLMFTTGGILVYGNMISNYGINTTTSAFTGSRTNISLNETLDTKILDLTKAMKDSTFDIDVKGEDQSWTSLVKGSYGTLRLIPDIFRIIGELMEVIANEVGVPPFFFNTAMTLLMVAITFSIIFLVFRFKG